MFRVIKGVRHTGCCSMSVTVTYFKHRLYSHVKKVDNLVNDQFFLKKFCPSDIKSCFEQAYYLGNIPRGCSVTKRPRGAYH